MSEQKRIYCDNNATTPLDPRVFEKMMPYFTEKFGNPHSRSHSFGWEAEEAIEQARTEVANLIGATPKEIIFTSGATESNNMALKGVARFYKDKRNHIITVQTEHKCVLDACRHLEEEGFSVTYLPVDKEGLLDLSKLVEAITPATLLVSVMAVNNEIGVIQPLAEIGKICRERGIFFHTDAAQAFGKIPLNVIEMHVDLMSISSHKIYGPKGVGALYVGRNPRVRMDALISGGGQERGMRSGTLPTPLIVGLGEAAAIAAREMGADSARIKKLTDKFIDAILAMPETYLNGSRVHRVAGNANLSFSCIEGESMIGALKGIAVSSGSACTSASLEPSYVLQALGVDEELAHTSLRFSFGRFNTEEEIDQIIETVTKSVARLREISPLWEMMQEGIDLKSINWAGH
ncbi:MAG: IscS subfamily cysteine desulfurase [Proteobacteria bacterium]|nr:IscS subfamily cysteine desulfurase [Pseudomonadota bacterium]